MVFKEFLNVINLPTMSLMLCHKRDFQVIKRTRPARPFDKIRKDLCFGISSYKNL